MTKLDKILLKNKIILILYNLFMLALAYLLNRFVQMLMFLLFFNMIQSCFTNRFHADYIETNAIKATRLCKLITFIIDVLYLLICQNFNISIYYHLLLILSIATVNCLVGYAVQNITYKSLKDCTEVEILNLCNKAELSEIAIKRIVKHYIHKLTIKEIASQECVEEQTIKMSINRSKKKLNNLIKS